MSPRELPIYELEDRLIAAVKGQGRLIVQAPTGSGKSTQVPQMREISSARFRLVKMSRMA